jgi:hypothetical protein
LKKPAANVLTGAELILMIRKSQFLREGCNGLSFAEQFYALTGKNPFCLRRGHPLLPQPRSSTGKATEPQLAFEANRPRARQ